MTTSLNVQLPATTAKSLNDEQRLNIQARLRRHYLADDARYDATPAETTTTVEVSNSGHSRAQTGSIRLLGRLTLRGA